MSLTMPVANLLNIPSAHPKLNDKQLFDYDVSEENPILLEIVPGEQKFWIQTLEGLGIWFSDIDPTSRCRLVHAAKSRNAVPIQIVSNVKLNEETRKINVLNPHYIYSPTSYHPNILAQFIRLFMSHPKRGAEIGVLGGDCGSKLLQYFPSLFLYGVDSWQSYPEYGQDLANLMTPEEWPAKYQLAVDTYNSTGRDRFRMLKCWSTEPLVQNLDFVFIDANHETEFVKNDIKHWYPCVKRGGLIIGHDYLWPNDKQPTVRPGVLQALEELDVYPIVYLTDYWVWGFVK